MTTLIQIALVVIIISTALNMVAVTVAIKVQPKALKQFEED